MIQLYQAPMRPLLPLLCACVLGACIGARDDGSSADAGSGGGADSGITDAGAMPDAGARRASLPLVPLSDAPLPGRATRFDYQDVDPGKSHLVVAHMNDGELLIVALADGSVLSRLQHIPVVRGVVAADDVGLIFATSSPNTLVIVDNTTLMETA